MLRMWRKRIYSCTNVKNGKCQVYSQDDILVSVVAEKKHCLKRVDFHHFIFDLDNLNFRMKFWMAPSNFQFISKKYKNLSFFCVCGGQIRTELKLFSVSFKIRKGDFRFFLLHCYLKISIFLTLGLSLGPPSLKFWRHCCTLV